MSNRKLMLGTGLTVLLVAMGFVPYLYATGEGGATTGSTVNCRIGHYLCNTTSWINSTATETQNFTTTLTQTDTTTQTIYGLPPFSAVFLPNGTTLLCQTPDQYQGLQQTFGDISGQGMTQWLSQHDLNATCIGVLKSR